MSWAAGQFSAQQEGQRRRGGQLHWPSTPSSLLPCPALTAGSVSKRSRDGICLLLLLNDYSSLNSALLSGCWYLWAQLSAVCLRAIIDVHQREYNDVVLGATWGWNIADPECKKLHRPRLCQVWNYTSVQRCFKIRLGPKKIRFFTLLTCLKRSNLRSWQSRLAPAGSSWSQLRAKVKIYSQAISKAT